MIGKRKELRGIDVSSYQGKILWREVKQFGIDFAILRVTERNGIDAQFKRNAKYCELRDIKYGVYKFSYALSPADARKEANDVVKALRGYKLSYPVFYDIEWSEQKNLGPAAIERIVLAFFDVIKDAGYEVGIYCNLNWYKTVLTDKLKKYPLWIASYPADDEGVIVERLRPSVGMGWQYSAAGYVPGIDGNVDMDVFYEYEDAEEEVSEPVTKDGGGVTSKDILDIARSWLGKNEEDGSFMDIVDLYNTITPLPVGYKMSYYDEWCACFVSTLFWKAGAINLIGGGECSCLRLIKLFENMGIWEEDGTITPQPGWIILFSWNVDEQPNDAVAMHVGIVEYVENGWIHTIEGNANECVARRAYPIGDGNIRGYGKVRYAVPSESASNSPTLRKDPQCVGRAMFDGIKVRSWAGIEYPQIKSYPILNKDNLVDICDALDGWYYVRIAGSIYGFVDAKEIKIV